MGLFLLTARGFSADGPVLKFPKLRKPFATKDDHP
jgi:hypothetical protein